MLTGVICLRQFNPFQQCWVYYVSDTASYILTAHYINFIKYKSVSGIYEKFSASFDSINQLQFLPGNNIFWDRHFSSALVPYLIYQKNIMNINGQVRHWKLHLIEGILPWYGTIYLYILMFMVGTNIWWMHYYHNSIFCCRSNNPHYCIL